MARVFSLQGPGPAGTLYAYIDDSGNINAEGELRIDGVAIAAIDTSGGLNIPDTISLTLGTGGTDDIITPSGTATLWAHVTGNLTIDNQNATGATIMLLGTDTTATKFEVQNNSAAALFSVTPASATAATVLIAGTLDLNGILDLDIALTGTGDAANITTTISHATQVAEGLDVTASQITNVRTAGTVTGVQSTVVSLSGDTAGVDYYSFWAKCTAGEAAADHLAFKVGAGFDAVLDFSSCATGEADLIVADNLAIGFQIREAANVFWTICTTNDAERITAGKVTADTLTGPIDMANGAWALVYGTAGASQTKVLGNVVIVDANGGSQILTLPAVATSVGVTLFIHNNGGEDVVLKDVAAATICTVSTAESAFVSCDGSNWFGGVVKAT